MVKTKGKVNIQTIKKDKARNNKEKSIHFIKENINSYDNIYLIKLQNRKNVHINKIKSSLKNCILFSGKNRLCAIALGKTAKDEIRKNSHQFSAFLKSENSILFTDLPREEVKKVLKSIKPEEYATEGSISTKVFLFIK